LNHEVQSYLEIIKLLETINQKESRRFSGKKKGTGLSSCTVPEFEKPEIYIIEEKPG